jgi:hypothetical protein
VILEFDLLLSHTNRPYANRLLSLIVCGGAFVVPLRAQTVSAAPPVQTAAVSSSQEEAELVGQLNALIATDDAATNELGAEGIVPLTKGFNASFVTTSQHDSASGWSSLMTPNIAYRFDKHFSLNVGLPVYNYIDVDIVTPAKTVKGVVIESTTTLVTEHLLLGDTTLNGGFDAHSKRLDYNLSATLGMPTGDDANGLGAGQFTYSFINHFEHSYNDYLTPNIELGIDDSPNLADERVRKSYTDVGTNAHFQAGFSFSLPFDINFETNAYEELPLSGQTVTSVTTNGKKGKQLRFIKTTSQEGIGEDNGFENTLDIPLSGHVTLSGFYNRSLRDKIDTAGFSFTFLLRGPPRKKKTMVH